MAKRKAQKKSTRRRSNGTAVKVIKARLERQRQEILDLYVHDLREGQKANDNGAEDLVDRANDAYAREFMLSLSGGERDRLFEIDDALARLDSGEYGTCSSCDKKIGGRRLQAVPWARYCIDCQELSEQGMLHEG